MTSYKGRLFVIRTTSIVDGSTIYLRTKRGQKHRWTKYLNQAFPFTHPDQAYAYVRRCNLKPCDVVEIQRETTLKDEKKHPLGKLLSKWSGHE
jgi:hypothetical protein